MKVRLNKGESVIVQHREWYPGETRDIHPAVFEGLQKKYPGRFAEIGGEDLSVPAVPPGEQIEGQGLPAVVEAGGEVPPSPQPSPSKGEGVEVLTPALPREGDTEVKNVGDASGTGGQAGSKRAGARRRAKR